MKETTNGLRAARKAARLTQAELAELAGTTGATINKLETGTRKLTVEWAQRLSSHLGIAPLALFSENVSPYDTRDGEQTFVAVHSLKIRGEIGAGVWMLKELAPFRIEQEVSAVSGKWQVFSQIAFRHRGDGMTAARIYDGDCVIVVDYSEAKRA